MILLNGYSQKYTFKDMHAENNVDSLEKWLTNNPKVCEERLKNLIKIEVSYLWKTSSKTFKHLNEIEKISIALNHRLGIGFFRLQKALLLNGESKNREAYNYLFKALNDAESINDLSAQISIVSYQSLISLNYNKYEKGELSEYYLTKVKKIISQSNDPHDKLLFLITALNNAYYTSDRNVFHIASLINQTLVHYHSNKKLLYAYEWIQFIEGDFNYQLKNYEKSLKICHEALDKIAPDNFYMLTKMLLCLGNNYAALGQYDKAISAYNQAILLSHRIPSDFHYPVVRESRYHTLIDIFLAYRKLKLNLKDISASNMLTDSIFYYQKIDAEETNRKAILQIQYQYSLNKIENEFENLSNEKKMLLIQKRDFQIQLQIKQKNIEALSYRNKLRHIEEKLQYAKIAIERKNSIDRAKAIENENKFLNIYIVFGYVLLLFTVVILIILRIFYIKEKKINNFRTQFYTILTHDLRTSINSLTGMGSLLSSLIRKGKTDDMFIIANQMDLIGYETSLLLDNTIDWGTSRSFEVDMTPGEINISLLIVELILYYQAIIDSKNIKVTYDIPKDIILTTSLKCITVILKNMIANAISNTVKYGHVEVFVEKIEYSNQVAIHVKNSGVITPHAKILYIQDVFDRKVKPEVGEYGIGLGVILMTYFAKKNNSMLTVVSEQQTGTCFSLFING
jgi:signal transduction histidine kinase